VIRRKTRTALQRELLAYKQLAPISIGETREEKSAREHVDEAAVIQQVHDYIWRTRSTCQLCRGRRRNECAGFPDEMHEEPPRSATRGLPPAERFNLLVCGRLCKACHGDITGNKLTIVFLKPALGFLGPVRGEPVP
jgi:hypothetical protein